VDDETSLAIEKICNLYEIAGLLMRLGEYFLNQNPDLLVMKRFFKDCRLSKFTLAR